MFCSLSFNALAETFTFVVAGNEPPLSSELNNEVVGIIPDLINDSLIPFHIGVRQSHPVTNELISEIDAVVGSEKFLKEVQELVDSFR